MRVPDTGVTSPPGTASPTRSAAQGIKIARIDCFPLRYPEPHDSGKPRYITLVRIEAADGAFGWGECISQWPEAALAVKVIIDRGLAPLLAGRDAFDIRALWELMRLHSTWYGTGGVATFAISAIDIALHDLKGRALGVPVYQLLGGKVTPSFRAVASIILDMVDIDATSAEFAGYVSRGYTAVKGGWGKSAETAFGRDAGRDLLLVRKVREAVGPDIAFMVDVGTHVKWDVAHAIQMTRRFEEYGIHWIEEPLPPNDFDGYLRLRQAIQTLVATGEKGWTVQEFQRMIDCGIADFLMPDVGKAEGITGVKQVIESAALKHQFYNPHSWSSAINTAASLHLCASATNAVFFELKPNPNPMQHELVEEPIDQVNGRVTVSDKPGLGIEVREDVVRKYLFE
jgi:L-alanine-DL-glutamate epimerase-like enolase superfamily enzyme